MCILLQQDKGTASTERVTTPIMTKYERARVLGTRALQIAMGAPVMVELEGGWGFEQFCENSKFERVKLNLSRKYNNNNKKTKQMCRTFDILNVWKMPTKYFFKIKTTTTKNTFRNGPLGDRAQGAEVQAHPDHHSTLPARCVKNENIHLFCPRKIPVLNRLLR